MTYTGPSDGALRAADDGKSIQLNILNVWSRPNIHDLRSEESSDEYVKVTDGLQPNDQVVVSFTITGLKSGNTADETPEHELELADLDGSGTLDSTDVFYLMLGIAQSAVGISPDWTAAQEKAADIDGSGKVDSTDVFYLMLYIARKGAGIPTTWEDIIG